MGYHKANGTRENTRIHNELLGGGSLTGTESGALYLIRTDDPFITNEVLYQLS